MSARAGTTQSTTLIALGALLALAFLAAMVGGRFRRESQTTGTSMVSVKPVSSQAVIAPLGRMNAGCNASTCHGGTSDSLEPNWRNAGTMFAEHDPHAYAYEALFTPRSRAIVSKLLGEELDSSAYQSAVQKHCAACHAGEFAADHADASVLFRQTGVSCEACHGPASAWLEEHLASDWKQRDRESLGYRDLSNPTKLAQTCTACHIGSNDAPEGMSRRVTHDLMAAGHPTLDFDLVAWLRQMPAHWSERPQAADHKPRNEVALWREGVLAGDQRVREEASDELDFARFDCRACHHPLASPAKIADSQGKLVGRDRTWLAEDAAKITNIDELRSLLMERSDELHTSERIISWYYAAETATRALFGEEPIEEVVALRRAIEDCYEAEPHRYALPSLAGDKAVKQAIDRLRLRLKFPAGEKS